jgi:chaperone protein EcpD
LVSVTVAGKKQQTRGQMIAPKSSTEFKFANAGSIASGSKLDTEFVNDYGAINPMSFTVK